MIVVDASVLATALMNDDEHGLRARDRFRGERLFAPELVDIEVLSVLRSGVRSGRLPRQRAAEAWQDLQRAPVARARHRPFLPRIWQLHDNLSSYDAAYVALAEALDATLLTADKRLVNAPGPRCRIEQFT